MSGSGRGHEPAVNPQPGIPDWAHMSPERRAHVERVADLLRHWADAMQVPVPERERWLRAAYLHDALRDADPGWLERLVPDSWSVASLRHGPAAARLAEENGETDPGVLAAVRYHSVGYAGWDRVGQALYLADYLEPGRRFQEAQRQDWAARVPREFSQVLREVAAERLGWVVRSGRPLLAESVSFWNALVGSP
jgi:HD superfamily phosphohydrolase YqeK